ncbi:hypothetical protein [Kordiimonas sp.]|uniref:hypothetical protein n=1 Tax=Kordiimonas sp. TaxID=1970157 RepID=UPI003A908C93
MTDQKLYGDFLGIWELEPETCEYEQSEPPQQGHYIISECAEGLLFQMTWTDSAGEEHNYSFTGVPDGTARPFAGGELADALAVSVPSDSELTSSAYYKGNELMRATRLLHADGMHMDVLQTVHLPDGTKPTNKARYRRKLHS